MRKKRVREPGHPGHGTQAIVSTQKGPSHQKSEIILLKGKTIMYLHTDIYNDARNVYDES